MYCTMYMQEPSEVRRKHHILELELRMVINHYVGAGNETQLLYISIQFLTPVLSLQPANYL